MHIPHKIFKQLKDFMRLYSEEEQSMTNNENGYQWHMAMLNAMLSRKYSAATRKRYMAICWRIAQAFPDKDLRTLGKRELESFLANMERAGASASTINQAISAATFLWRNVFELPCPIKVRPIKDKRLPTVIARNQVMQLIAAANTSKTRLALALAYSAGLRVSEIAKLQLSDIDRERGVIFIKAGKGRKDRVVPLSALVADMLDQYLANHPTKRWIFPNSTGGHTHVRSLQIAMAAARNRAGLASDVTMHTLRHSFATHLVERGENLVVVKELMGHSSLSTVQQYVHIANTGILATKSPLDSPPLY
jgi:integrase/recombinase XerD